MTCAQCKSPLGDYFLALGNRLCAVCQPKR